MIHFQQLYANAGSRGFKLSFVEAAPSKTGNASCICHSEEFSANPRANRSALHQKITRRLLSAMREYSPCHIVPVSNNGPSVTVDKTRLGRPVLDLDGVPGPSISFSYHKRRIWGAMCEMPQQCGIDVASASEFDEKFPLQKVFSPQEFNGALQFAGSVESTLALLWSVKEAVVKAVGCGFHLIDPSQVCLERICSMGSFVTVRPRIEFPPHVLGTHWSSDSLQAVCFPDREKWVSVAIADTPPIL